MTIAGLSESDLLAAFGAGLLAIVITGLFRPLRPWGPLVVALVAAVTLRAANLAPLQLVIGVAIAAIGARWRAVRWPAAAAGSVVVALGLSPTLSGAAVEAMAVVSVTTAWGLGELDEIGASRLPALAIVVALGGAAWTVPDIEEVILVAAVLALPVAVVVLLGVNVAERSLAPLAVTLAWAVAQGARGRPSAVVGGLGCLTLIAVLAGALAGTDLRRNTIPKLAVLAVVQLLATVVMSRAAGLQDGVAAALALAVVAAVADFRVVRYLM